MQSASNGISWGTSTLRSFRGTPPRPCLVTVLRDSYVGVSSRRFGWNPLHTPLIGRGKLALPA